MAANKDKKILEMNGRYRLLINYNFIKSKKLRPKSDNYKIIRMQLVPNYGQG